MSTPRMCDVPVGSENGKVIRCRKVFSELDEDWSTGQVSVMRRNPKTRRLEPVMEDQDRCPEHSAGIAEAITGESLRPDYEHIAALEASDLDVRIRNAQEAKDRADYEAWKAQREKSNQDLTELPSVEYPVQSTVHLPNER